jgi:multisubunit Na+/H+ antiporter MnhG subunit
MMIDFPTWVSGTVTIVALIGLGIFIYPWLLNKKGGAGAVGAITVMLAFLFYAFDSSRDVPIAVSAALAVLWALAPVAAGAIVHRLQRRSA